MEKKVRTVCFDCHSKCGVILTVDDNNDIVRVEGDPDCPVNDGILCVKAFSAQEIHAHPDRLKYPLKRAGKRGEGKWRPITWDQLITEVTEGGKLFADIGENQDIEGFKALHDTEKPMNPDQPDLGPISNQVVFLGGRGDGRTTIGTRFSSNFGTINQYGHGST